MNNPGIIMYVLPNFEIPVDSFGFKGACRSVHKKKAISKVTSGFKIRIFAASVLAVSKHFDFSDHLPTHPTLIMIILSIEKRFWTYDLLT